MIISCAFDDIGIDTHGAMIEYKLLNIVILLAPFVGVVDFYDIVSGITLSLVD